MESCPDPLEVIRDLIPEYRATSWVVESGNRKWSLGLPLCIESLRLASLPPRLTYDKLNAVSFGSDLIYTVRRWMPQSGPNATFNPP